MTAQRGSRGIALLSLKPQREMGGVDGQLLAPVAFPRENPSTHCTEGWVDLRAGLDG